MGLCPEEMERWGAGHIFKESAILLRKHYRLFLPFFLAFYFPASLFSLLLVAPDTAPTFLISRIVNGSANNTAQSITDGPPADLSFAAIFFSLTLLLVAYVLGTLGTGAVCNIIDYLYTPTRPDDDDEDRSLVPRKVFQFLPRAFLRLFVTDLWAGLAVLLLCLFTGLLVVVPCGIIYAVTGWSNTVVPTVVASFLVLAGLIFLGIAFALAQIVAALEPGNYGREALKRSAKLARTGRVWTIVGVTISLGILEGSVPKPGGSLTAAETPVWAKVVLGVCFGGLNSMIGLYSGVVVVVMYFAYKARFDAAGIDLLKRMDSAKHSYEPIVEVR